MRTELITPPVYNAVSLDEAKDYLRITHSDEDPSIQAFCMAAQAAVEHWARRKLITQTWNVYLLDWPKRDCITLPFGQLQSVTHVKYTDTDGTQSTFSSDDYTVETTTDPGRIVLNYNETWPTATLATSNPIEIQFVCGYGAHTPQAVTGATNAAPIVLTIVGHGYTSNDVVYVYDVGGNTAADGLWRITKVTDDTFSLQGSTGSAAYTSGGYAIRHDVPEAVMTAIKVRVADMYENRESMVVGQGYTLTKTNLFETLLWPYRLWCC